MGRRIVVESYIRGDVETVHRLAQTPADHVRWDLRFTDIDELPTLDSDAPKRFRYATRIGLGLAIEGWGETVASKGRDGSVLRFGSQDPRSLIEEGTGSWTYVQDVQDVQDVQENGRVRFGTVYDYRVRHGRVGALVDRVAFRPLMAWATRWSFDRLRLWIERGLAPEIAMRLWLVKRAMLTLLGIVWILSGLIPKLLFVRESEVALVEASRLVIGSPLLTLQMLGAAEVAIGVWLLSGIGERVSVTLTALGTLALGGLVATLDPAAMTDPYGGIVKNLGLLGCSLVVLALSSITPKASRARPRRRVA